MRVALALCLFVAACVDQGGTSGRGGGSDDQSCCELYPDVEAVSACAALPAGACGKLHCELGDGSAVDIGVCGPAKP